MPRMHISKKEFERFFDILQGFWWYLEANDIVELLETQNPWDAKTLASLMHDAEKELDKFDFIKD